MYALATMHDIELPQEALDLALEWIMKCGPNDSTLHALTLTLQGWDHAANPEWSQSTEPHSNERRKLVLSKLGIPENYHDGVNTRVPRFSASNMPVIIATDHVEWYAERKRRIKEFYWSHYATQLLPPKGKWSSDAVSILNTSVEDVVSRLSDPTREAIYPVKGLVVGYVQSGKTSHFSGLIAKAADAGYRLIIVLAGTLDILRMQTQRRIDKEIVGQELLGTEEYGRDPDWAEFVSHGDRPSDLGSFDWERLTNRDDDYQILRRHLEALEFRSHDRSKPFNHIDNLAVAPARLAVVKKIPVRLKNLCDDLEALRELRSKLEHVPTLVIDDESDQASINTVQGTQQGDKAARTKTNAAISRLLKLLPRAQYVGYTATPFANVFIDPEDPEDLFPKDFIVTLPRPEGYMGVADFFDFDKEYDANDFASNRNAFVRSVVGDNEDVDNLPKAIDSFVLSGAIKLFRQDCDPQTFTFRHHTMLVHHSSARVVHEADRQVVESIFRNGARYQQAKGLQALEDLFVSDFVPVSKARGDAHPFPSSFQHLRPYVVKCLSKVCSGKSVLVVNGDNKDDTPSFEEGPVWAILVGGTKLSRGYTVEGLTVSYYRRPAGAGDTLMQMGRWFGFRGGYRDLVRLFIGTREKKGRATIDLYEAFGAVCRDEESLRADLAKYSLEGLKPFQVPPLVRQHLPVLPPTSRNKMFNAEIRSVDFAGEWTEKTSAPTKTGDRTKNREAVARLLNSAKMNSATRMGLTNHEGTARSFDAVIGSVSGASVLVFVREYIWADGRQSNSLEVSYIEKRREAGDFADWTILLPHVRMRKTFTPPIKDIPQVPVIERRRVATSRIGVYSEPRHREAARFLVGLGDVSNVSDTLQQWRSDSRPVIVVYFIEESGYDDLSIGFCVQYPGTKKEKAITWSVRDKNAGAVVPTATQRTGSKRR
jgi:hypothetical protein